MSIDSKEWTRRLLAGTARSTVRRVKNAPVSQLVGVERTARQYEGFSPDETASIIHRAIAEVPNPVAETVEAVKKRDPFPAVEWKAAG